MEVGVGGVLDAASTASAPTEASAIVLVDRAISVFSIIVLGSIAYWVSSKRRGAGISGLRTRVRSQTRRLIGERTEAVVAAPASGVFVRVVSGCDRTAAPKCLSPEPRQTAPDPTPIRPFAWVSAPVRTGDTGTSGPRRDSSGSAELPARARHGAPSHTMTSQNGRAFNEWLRAQLKAKKMSQRQLAQQSGVDHSTISRLIRGDRMPSLGTATKLARGLRELREDADTAQYLGLVTAGAMNPTARVEYALRADEMLSEPQVRQIMEYYLAVRMRRFGRAFPPPEGSQNRPPDRPVARSQPSIGGPVVAGVGQASRSHVQLSPDRTADGPSGPPLTGLTPTFPRARPGSPSTSGSRGQRMPASGAPAFALSPAVGCRAWTPMAALPPALLAHARLKRVRSGARDGALPSAPIRDERSRAERSRDS